ncbi:MAG: hypothetical protein GXP37_00055, partial [Chloroflexi bacterium]|nr:hypothetical protein [Chloroflexota bacterium]
MCDVPGCLAKTKLRGETVRFNLHLTDPIRQHLPADSPWQGVAGDYVISLGPESQAEPGSATGLDTVSTSVGTWTRLWLGVLPASSL